MEQFGVQIITIIGAIFTIFGGWCIWLTIRIFSAEKDIAVNTTNDQKVGNQITELKSDFNNRVDKLEKHMGEQFDKVFEKIDLIRK